jgi:hypothetical protein
MNEKGKLFSTSLKEDKKFVEFPLISGETLILSLDDFLGILNFYESTSRIFLVENVNDKSKISISELDIHPP